MAAIKVKANPNQITFNKNWCSQKVPHCFHLPIKPMIKGSFVELSCQLHALMSETNKKDLFISIKNIITHRLWTHNFWGVQVVLIQV